MNTITFEGINQQSAGWSNLEALLLSVLAVTVLITTTWFIRGHRDRAFYSALFGCFALGALWNETWEESEPSRAMPRGEIYSISSPVSTELPLDVQQGITIKNDSGETLRVTSMQIDSLQCGPAADDIVLECRPGSSLKPGELCSMGCIEATDSGES